MSLLGIDLGGTKVAFAIFSEEGKILDKESIGLGNRTGFEVGKCITEHIIQLLKISEDRRDKVKSIGISVPGISHIKEGTVWAPNINGWTDYHLYDEVKKVCKEIPLTIDSDRACYILGEVWKGKANGCKDAIFLAVGTGIGAGILINGEVLRGSNDIAGCTGWLALSRPFNEKYINCGCFEYYASGEGIAKVAKEFLKEHKKYNGILRDKNIESVTSYDIFSAYEKKDTLAIEVINLCIEFWGMAIANLVSLFNPEKIILGGGVFGPAVAFIPEIRKEAVKWAQPVGMKQVCIEASALSGDAGVYGAGYLALRQLKC